MQPKIYHNPKCSKSRQTLALLQDRGFSPELVPYLESKPGPAELAGLVRMLGITPRALLRSGEAEYGELGLGDENMADTEILAAIAAHPILMQRPIVVHNGRARIGRPPEAVLEIL